MLHTGDWTERDADVPDRFGGKKQILRLTTTCGQQVMRLMPDF
jgi:hypothetical protein